MDETISSVLRLLPKTSPMVSASGATAGSREGRGKGSRRLSGCRWNQGEAFYGLKGSDPRQDWSNLGAA